MMNYKDGLKSLKRYGLVLSGAYFLSLLGCAGTHQPKGYDYVEYIYHKDDPIKIEAISPTAGEGILESMFPVEQIDTTNVLNRLFLEMPAKAEGDTTGQGGTVIRD
jgi:hypothetical protein